MEQTQTNVEPVTISEVMGLDTWNTTRSDEELNDFISRREAAIANL